MTRIFCECVVCSSTERWTAYTKTHGWTKPLPVSLLHSPQSSLCSSGWKISPQFNDLPSELSINMFIWHFPYHCHFLTSIYRDWTIFIHDFPVDWENATNWGFPKRKVSDLVDVHTQGIGDQRSRGTTSPDGSWIQAQIFMGIPG